MTGFSLGIDGRSALVCGASKGLGRACAEALAQAGARLTICARSEGPLKAAAAEIEALAGQPVTAVAADVTTEAGRAALVAACPDPDILVTNAAGPPPGRFEDWGEAEWQAATSANMIAPLLLIRAVVGGMRRRRWGRIVNITSSAVKAPLPMLGLSNGARAGLTGAIGGIAREVARDGVTINNLLPGHFATDRLESYLTAVAAARGVPPETVRAEVAAANPTGRVGQPPEFGATCAFLASAHAGYVTGQNILMDGGLFPGLF
ncbi:SDR family oxidoreductase [Phenylobacterium sp.]|uniref:SDR family oxidoreductase n=1 Tax=Phenylobacterium sp. TaxID=1871053 RepID=UPI001207B6BF|nr:SDR family oxidoreductase [Phenylobacterium sp.]THD60657.1 MAG: SDR family oxidoreductase [Phenylobacterium sp.]